MLKVENVYGGYKDHHHIIKNVSFHVQTGEFFTLIGPNGSGKTTLFKLITGALSVGSGSITLMDQPLSSFTTFEKAKFMAVLSQEENVEFDFTVKEIVTLGRYAHQKGFIKTNSKKDLQIVEQAMEITKISDYKNKPFKNLSGGEKQRVLLAKALAQEPKILLLDEPTNHLDIKHTFEMMSLLKDWQQNYNLTVLAILHDLNSAALFADRIGLMKQGELVQIGNHTILSEEELLENVYEVNIASQAHPKIAKSQLFLTPKGDINIGSYPFYSAYEIKQDEQLIHVTFQLPLRTVSNAVIGEGISWASQFCNFHVSENYQGPDFKQDLTSLMEERNFPTTQSIAMMTSVKLTDCEVVKETIQSYSFLVIVTAGTEGAVDICQLSSLEPMMIGTINIMVFVDGQLSDGDLLYALQASTEAKTKALFDLKIVDKTTGTLATGTLSDSVVIAATQQGAPTISSGNNAVLGKGIGKLVYQAVTQALENHQKRNSVNKGWSVKK